MEGTAASMLMAPKRVRDLSALDSEKSGAGGGTRTHDLGIMRPSLYP